MPQPPAELISETSSGLDADVAIVGAGPVGLTLAILLGVAGVHTVLIETSAGPTPDPRAVHFDGEIMRVFQSMGLADRVSTIIRPTAEMRFEDEGGDALFTVEWGLDPGDQGWIPANLFHQPDLERVLRDAARELPTVQLLFDHTLIDFDDVGDRIRIDVRDKDSVSARLDVAYLIGCDGASSTVRRLMGAAMDLLGPAQPWLVIDGALLRDDGRLPQWPVQYPWPERPHFFMRNVDDRVRWEYRIMPGDDRDAIASPRSVSTLIAPMVDPADVRIDRAAGYTFRSMVAERWSDGRVLVAGDAAHLQPPFMAQGMCSGIRDAANLAWKLRRALDGDTRFLADYEAERKPHAQAWIHEATRVSELCQVLDATVAAKRNEALQAMGHGLAPILPGLGRGAVFGSFPAAGRLSSQLTLADGRSLDDVAGGRFVLLTDDDSSPVSSDVLVVHAAREPDVAASLVELEASHALLRPDHYWAGAVGTPRERDRLLAALVG